MNTPQPQPLFPTLRRAAVLLTLLATTQLHAATLLARFDTDPLAAGWTAHGNTNLFAWNTTNASLNVTWDSAQPNSYCARPLGQTLSRSNDFLVRFDLRLADIAAGVDPNKPFTFQIALGLLHHSQLTNARLARGSGYAPNLVEFDYFPNDTNDYGASISTALISSVGNYWSGGFTFPLELHTNVTYRFQMIFTAADQTLRSTLLTNGVPVASLNDARIEPAFGDFALDTFAVSSYSDQGQFPGYEGSLLAHGTVDNVVIAAPLPVRAIAATTPSAVQFLSDAAWSYTLECTTNLVNWSPAAPAVPGNGTLLTLTATNAPPAAAFFRVRADLP